ncbi:hypothetical protein [Trichocoleus sp. FACHB-262]|uniref:hypothetical protein n=1 Tax=Trichocoleus sp. FACHB-262 TaxID=2692869 RepID=UPI0016837B77|nr:hypothetical protein [Trichocoleus sp. FACHB-262]MBD2123251.1 hypothetical protein [Trichocoleus sp. FACHB-262]
METTRTFAILAPVPEIHLLSGLEAIAAQLNLDEVTSEGLPKVAFGSMAFEVIRKADELRKERAVEVLIYASEAQGDQPLNPEVWWRARYIGHVPSRNGRYPGKSMFRPQSTAGARPTWAIYWEVQELEKLKAPIAIASLQGLGQKAPLKGRFVPEDPVLIEYPFAAFVAISRQAAADRK